MKTYIKLLALMPIIFSATLLAQEGQSTQSSDKTGTNPINFTNDARLYNEYSFLNTPGDGSQNTTIFEFRTPFADGKWQFRTRMRGVTTKLDANDDGVNEIDDSGLGDIDFRFLTVPYLNMAKKMAFAAGIETFLPTASKATLGSRRLSLGPQAFLVFFTPFGIANTLIAPAYQHKFSVSEKDDLDSLHQGLIDVFMLWSSSNKQYWALLDPKFILDYKTSQHFSLLDIEMGTMLDNFLKTKGHSVYLRPSIGIGHYRPKNASIEVGYKIIW